MNKSCLIYRFKMFLLTYFMEGQAKGKDKVFPEFRFYTTHLKLRRKLKGNGGWWSKNKRESQAIAISVHFEPPQDIDVPGMMYSRIIRSMGSKAGKQIMGMRSWQQRCRQTMSTQAVVKFCILQMNTSVFGCAAVHKKFPGLQCSLHPKQLENSDLSTEYVWAL